MDKIRSEIEGKILDEAHNFIYGVLTDEQHKEMLLNIISNSAKTLEQWYLSKIPEKRITHTQTHISETADEDIGFNECREEMLS